MNWKRQPWLVIDTETTGADPKKAHVIELGAVLFQDGRALSRMGMLVKPRIVIPEQATKVHGITNADVHDAPRLEDVAGRFLRHVSDAKVLVGYNWPYDAEILDRQLGASWQAAIDGKVIIDPLVVVRLDSVGRFWKGKGRHRLANVAERLGVQLPKKQHRASADALVAAMVLSKLLKHLPDNGAEASALIKSERAKQDADFQQWKRKKQQEQRHADA